MDKPLVSVIIPVYNAQNFLKESFDSIANQTYQNLEIIAVNDKSTDASETIIKEYAQKDSRFILLQNKFEKGISGALNTGLEASKGELIARADADDILRLDRFETQIEFFKIRPDVFFIGGGYAPFNEKGHRLDIFHPSNSVELAWKMILNSYFCHPSVMFRRSVYDEMGGYSSEKAEDFEYFSRIIKEHRCSNIHKILLDYREHTQGLSNTNASPIAESAKKIAFNNYKYYIPSADGYDIFVKFQTTGYFSIKDLLKLFKINLKIVNKIRKNYGLMVYNVDWLSFNFTLLTMYTKEILKKIFK